CNPGLAQRHVRAKGHFKWRKSFGEELSRLHECGLRRALLEDPKQRFVMHHRHLEHADILAGGPSPQLVPLGERGLARTRQIGGERLCVAVREPLALLSSRRPAHGNHLVSTTVVPRSADETSSKSSTRRLALERPSPRPSPVEYPSCIARSTSSMPG